MLAFGSQGYLTRAMPMTGRPTIDNTGARVRGQATNGYAPPGRNLPICGRGTTSEIEDPYEEQDAYLAALEEADS